jgi:hypothetical protein
VVEYRPFKEDIPVTFPNLPKAFQVQALGAILLLGALLTGAHPAGAAPQPPAAPASTPQATPAPTPAAAPPEEPAEKKYKNIQVLKGMPASQLMPVMHLMRSSLGVRCDFCHVAENGKYDLDTKRAKETARAMIRMTLEINKNNFEGRTQVTCNTCHRGAEHPVAVPPIAQAQFEDTTRGPETETRESLPDAAQVLDRYIQALGGREALESVRNRAYRGTLLKMKVVDSGTPEARAINRGQEEPFEIVQEAPNRQALTLREQAAKARVVGKDQIDGHDVYLLRRTAEDGNRQTLFFDVQSGLLRRQISYRQTVLGPDPEQIDYEDYREVGGVKVPFVIKNSYVDDNHLGTTRKLTEVRNNVEPSKRE